MEQETNTTMSTESRESEREAQSMAHHYVEQMIDYVIEHPFASFPQIFGGVAHGGPCTSPKNVLHLLGGPRMFKRICQRMGGLRWASIKDRLDLLPLTPDSDSSRDIRYSIMRNKRDENIEWWVPGQRSAEPLPLGLPEIEGVVMRYPSQIDTDEYFSETEGSVET